MKMFIALSFLAASCAAQAFPVQPYPGYRGFSEVQGYTLKCKDGYGEPLNYWLAVRHNQTVALSKIGRASGVQLPMFVVDGENIGSSGYLLELRNDAAQLSATVSFSGETGKFTLNGDVFRCEVSETKFIL